MIRTETATLIPIPRLTLNRFRVHAQAAPHPAARRHHPRTRGQPPLHTGEPSLAPAPDAVGQPSGIDRGCHRRAVATTGMPWHGPCFVRRFQVATPPPSPDGLMTQGISPVPFEAPPSTVRRRPDRPWHWCPRHHRSRPGRRRAPWEIHTSGTVPVYRRTRGSIPARIHRTPGHAGLHGSAPRSGIHPSRPARSYARSFEVSSSGWTAQNTAPSSRNVTLPPPAEASARG